MFISLVYILIFCILIAIGIIIVIITNQKQKIKKAKSTKQPLQKKKFPTWAPILIVVVSILVMWVLMIMLQSKIVKEFLRDIKDFFLSV